MTNIGGANNLGTIFKIMPNGTGFIKLLDFANVSNGSRPEGDLLYDGTFLYGMTTYGGTNNSGTIFKIMTDGTGFEKLHDFLGGTDGNQPHGSLVYDGTSLYGMTILGGTSGVGTLFKIMPNGTGYSKLIDFSGASNGMLPYGSLLYNGYFLYGMTYAGGTNDLGVIFKIMPDGNGFAKIFDFTVTLNGSRPYYTSLISDGTFLYGMTREGGTSNGGTIFKILTDGTGFVKLYDFPISSISNPFGSLIYDGTFLYGMTSGLGGGGVTQEGSIFKIMTNGTGFTTLQTLLGGSDGRYPLGSLIYIGTSIYGMTFNGGTNASGILFKYSGLPLRVADFNNNTSKFIAYPNPSSGIINVSSTNTIKGVIAYNILGKEVYNYNFSELNNEVIVDLSFLETGMYFLKAISENNNFQTIKVIKK